MIHDIGYYRTIQNARGSSSRKQTFLRVAQMNVNRDFDRSYNYEVCSIDGVSQEAVITPTKDAQIKRIKSRPNEEIHLGATIYWAHTYWMVTAMDFDDQLHCAGTMNQCTVVLKWQKSNGDIVTQYAVSEDATKYGMGIVYTDYIREGEFTIKVKVPLNEETLAIGRDQRFLIGFNGENYRPDAFKVTRINQITGTKELNKDDNTVLGDGYLEITMAEDLFRDTDNAELGIADYQETISDEEPTKADEPEGVLDEGGWFG